MTAAALLLATTPAAAEGDASSRAVARARGEEALRLFEARRWDEAYVAFARAETILHAPTLVLFMANCRKNQGRLAEARALYEQVAKETIPAGAPEQFKKAQIKAREELDALPPPAPTASPAGDATPAEPSPAGWKVGAGVAFALGAAGIAGGAAAGVLSLARIRAAHLGCAAQPEDTWICPPSREVANSAAASAAHTLTAAQVTSLALGGAAAAVGVVLVIVRPGAGTPAGVAVRVGPRSASVQGRF